MNNTNPRMIHETSLKDIIDIWDGIKNLKDADFSDKLSRKSSPMIGKTSIAKAASNLNLVFPVICSRGISIESASMISKAVEKNSVTMLQRLFASWQIPEGDINSVEDYIRSFHTNLSSRAASLDDLFRYTDGENYESVKPYKLLEGAIAEDLKNINYYLPTSHCIFHKKKLPKAE